MLTTIVKYTLTSDLALPRVSAYFQNIPNDRELVRNRGYVKYPAKNNIAKSSLILVLWLFHTVGSHFNGKTIGKIGPDT
jgi:hypothetical protein